MIVFGPRNDGFREDLRFAGIYFIFFFYPRVIFELRGLIGAKFCTMLGSVFDFIIPVQNFEGTSSPKKILWAINMQNLAQFWSTSNFDGEYLQKGWRYLKLVIYSIDSNSSRVRGKNLVNFGLLIAEISVWNYTHPNRLFRKTVFRPTEGVAPLNFYTC